jgi:hypothetical protein
MSRYGIDYYGLGYYGPDNQATYTAYPATATSVTYGTIRLNWVDPSGNWTKLKLVRNSYGFPTSPYDGITLVNVFSGSDPTEFIDNFDLKQGSFYYYSVFVYETTNYTWVRSANILGVSVKDYTSGDKMFEYLPEVYKLVSTYDVGGSTENTQLNGFLHLFGFQLDYAQTITELLIDRYDTQKVSGLLIPLLLNQFGLEYEPEIGLQQSRILARDAVQLYKEKGSLQGLKEYIKAFSGYALSSAVAGTPIPAVEGIVNGHNLMLDYNDSSFEESVGHWVSDSSAVGSISQLAEKSITNVALTSNVAKVTIGSHSYKVGTKVTIAGCPIPLFNQYTPVTITAVDSTSISFALTHSDVVLTKTTGALSPYPLPWNELTSPVNYPNKQKGVLAVNNISGSSAAVEFSCGSDNAVDKGIPVTAGLPYTFSIYTSAKSTTRSITAKIKWYNRFGVLLSTSSGSAISNTSGALSVRPYVTATAPANAYYAVPNVSIASVGNAASLEFHYFDAAQFEQASSATGFDEARRVHITLRANRINELVNPDFFAPYAPWKITGATYSTDPFAIEPGLDVFTVETAQLTSNVVTLSTTTVHHLQLGELISVIGVGSPFDGQWTVTGKTASTVSYALTNTNVPLTTVSGSVYHSGNALALTATATSATVTSATTAADYMPIHYPGNSYTFSFSAKSGAGAETVHGSISWYNISKVLISTTNGATFVIGTGWSKASVTSVAPNNAAYAVVTVNWDNTTVSNTLDLDQGIFENSPFVLPYFCGEADADTLPESDVFWEGGVANAGRSHYYKNRYAIVTRLAKNLPDYLPAGTTFDLFLAQPNT